MKTSIRGSGVTLEYSGGRCQRAGRRGDLVGMAAMPSFGKSLIFFVNNWKELDDLFSFPDGFQ